MILNSINIGIKYIQKDYKYKPTELLLFVPLIYSSFYYYYYYYYILG